MKKRLITSTLLLLTATLGTTTVSADSHDIQAEYARYDVSVVSVDISWGSLKYNYISGDTSIWDPATHQFTSVSGEPSWQSEEPGVSDMIKVTNHSNTPIETTFVLPMNDEFPDYDYTVDRIDSDVDHAAYIMPSKEGGAGETGTYQLNLSGTVSQEVDNTNLGTLHVTIFSGKAGMADKSGLYDLSGVQGDKLIIADFGVFRREPSKRELTQLKSELTAKGARLLKSSELPAALNMLKQTSPDDYADFMTYHGVICEDGINPTGAGTKEGYYYFEAYERTLK